MVEWAGTPKVGRDVNSGHVDSEPSMTTLVEELTQRARTLSAEDRARLAEDLLASLEAESDSGAESDAAWEQEIQRRVAEVKSGTAKLVSAEDVHAETSSLYRSNRPGVAPKD